MTEKLTDTGLIAYTENSLKAILQAKSQHDFEVAFDAFIAGGANITVNGKSLTVDEYKKHLLEQKSNTETATQVTFDGAVEVPTQTASFVYTGYVGLFYKAVGYHASGLVVESFTVQSSLNVDILTNLRSDIYPDHRVTALNEVSVKGPTPV